MTAIHFYHLTTSPLERALPKLLEKAYSNGFRTLLLVENEARAEQIDQLLWTYDPNSFLPHGVANGKDNTLQPILIRHPALVAGSGEDKSGSRNAYGMTLLFITNGHVPDTFEGYERVIDMFDGGNEDTIKNARTRWKNYKDQGLNLTYWKQNDAGGWEKA